MATGNNRDVRLGIAVETRGEDGVARLGANLRGLGDAAGDSTPELDRLGAELDQLAASTEARRRAEAAARSEATADKAALAAKRDELSKLKINTDAAGRSTTEYAATERALKLAIVDGAASLRTKQAAVTSAAPGLDVGCSAASQSRTDCKASCICMKALSARRPPSLRT